MYILSGERFGCLTNSLIIGFESQTLGTTEPFVIEGNGPNRYYNVSNFFSHYCLEVRSFWCNKLKLINNSIDKTCEAGSKKFDKCQYLGAIFGEVMSMLS